MFKDIKTCEFVIHLVRPIKDLLEPDKMCLNAIKNDFVPLRIYTCSYIGVGGIGWKRRGLLSLFALFGAVLFATCLSVFPLACLPLKGIQIQYNAFAVWFDNCVS